MMIGPVILALTFSIVGLVFLLFPLKVRRYDTRMTRLIKEEDGYRAATMVLGVIFLLFAVVALLLVFFGSAAKLK